MIGLLRSRLRGLAVSLVNRTIALVLMIFLLPAWLLDSILSGATLAPMLPAWLSADGRVEPKPISRY